MPTPEKKSERLRLDAVFDHNIQDILRIVKPAADRRWLNHLSKIDFDLLAEKFKQGKKRAIIDRLRAAIARKLEHMIRLNRTRMDYLEKFQKLIAEYNSGSRGVEETYKKLVDTMSGFSDEEQRHIKENLTEEELAIYDLFTKPKLEITNTEEKKIKKVARDLLGKLKQERFSLDWRKRQDARAAVQVTIEEVLDELPDTYSEEIYENKCDLVFHHVFESYAGG